MVDSDQSNPKVKLHYPANQKTLHFPCIYDILCVQLRHSCIYLELQVSERNYPDR